MCEESCNEKELLLLVGKDNSTDTEFYLQLFDVEKDEWYPHLTISREECDGAKAEHTMCLMDSKFYFIGEPLHESDENDDGKVSYFNFDFITKEITKMGRLLKLGNPWWTDYAVVEKCIYSFSDYVWCFNTEDKSIYIASNLGEFPFCRAGETANSNGLVYGCTMEGRFKSYNVHTRETKDYPIPEVNLLLNSMVILNGQLYSISIFDLQQMAIYTLETDEWSIFKTKGPSKIDHGRLIVCNGRLLCVERRCYIYEYHFDEKKWEILCRDYNGVICSNFNVFTIKKSYVSN